MVSGSGSNETGESGGRDRSFSPFTYTEKFEQLCPFYMAIGMTFEQYWDGDSTMVIAYRKAQRLRQDVQNQEAWLHGFYVYAALVRVAPVLHAFAKKGTKPEPYPSEPFEFYSSDEKTQKQSVEDKHDEMAKAYMTAFATAINKKFQEKGGGEDG